LTDEPAKRYINPYITKVKSSAALPVSRASITDRRNTL
jgi:hypothetical protein